MLLPVPSPPVMQRMFSSEPNGTSPAVTMATACSGGWS
ncbi:hypothetical protein EVA_10157 [gut metagenome]|uniref:Uncharacterized protein n=1 Tax=gut metagenome TaxID=749906 RepID=J9GP63_9ZZZZ